MYRLVTELSEPFTFVFLLTLVAFVTRRLGRRRPGRPVRGLGFGLLLLWALSTPLSADLAVGSLERPFPPVDLETVASDSIVVLASGVRDPNSLRPEPELAEGTIVRTLQGARLYHAGPPRPVIVSGGTASGATRIAPLMAELLVTLGVAERDIIVEDRSRNTYENAVESARLLRSRGLNRPALVTEATHLARSVRTFRGQGVEVVPVGCNYRASDLDGGWLWMFLPDAGAASTVRVVTHEWVGMAWYWFRGYFEVDSAPGA